MDSTAVRTFPFADLKVFELRIPVSAAGTHLARRKECRHLENLTAVFKGFVLKHSCESRP